MHKTLVIDWLTRVRNILQPSFVGAFHIVGFAIIRPWLSVSWSLVVECCCCCCYRQQREELTRKQEKLDNMLRKKRDGTSSGLIQPESPTGGKPSRPRKPLHVPAHRSGSNRTSAASSAVSRSVCSVLLQFACFENQFNVFCY